jgi:hypothetical protein
VAIALLTGSERSLVAGLSIPGVVGGGIFRRQTPDSAPFSSTLGGHGVGIFELDGTGGPPAELLAQMAISTGATAVATFTRLSEYSKKEGRSDLCRANSVLLVLVNNRDPSLDASFNRWYDDTHLPDVVNAGGFWIGTRYRSDTDGRYLVVYESDMTDSALARAGISAAIPKMVLWPHLEQLHVAGYGRVAP